VSLATSDGARVCTVGLTHLGCVVSAGLAALGHRVAAWDPDQERLAELRRGLPPIHEPGLPELLARMRAAGRLTFETNLGSALSEAEFALLTLDVPVDDRDEPDVSSVLDLAIEIAQRAREGATVVVMSQVPVGTCDRIKVAVEEAAPGREVRLAYVPENLKLGTAIERFLEPPLLVIGADDADSAREAERLLAPIRVAPLRMDLRSAEMTKHALNAFSATCISFANELAHLCEETGADGTAVAAALGQDPRAGPETPLRAGLGFSGGTLARDLSVLRAIGRSDGSGTPLLDGVLAVNQKQRGLIVEKLRGQYGSLGGLSLSVFGLTYKPGTSTLRRSMSLEVIGALTGQGSTIRAYDPMADLRELPSGLPIEVRDNPYEAVRDADGLLIMTEWSEFRDLDYGAIRQAMRQPVLVDAFNLLDREALVGLGFRYLGTGR
jgi:UDPglucose 6-dehydrogenase